MRERQTCSDTTYRPWSVWLRLTAHYVLALLLVAGLCLIGQLLVGSSVAMQTQYLDGIDAVNRQAALASRWERADGATRLALAQSLLAGQAHLARYLGTEELQTQLDSSTECLRQALVAGPPGDTGYRYREALEQLLVGLRQRALTRTRQVQAQELALLCLVLATLAVEGMWVFRPICAEIYVILSELNTARQALADRLKALRDSHEIIKADLKAAAAVQKSLLPREHPRIPGVSCAWSFKASHDVAGDMFNIIRLDDNHMAVFLLDVSGHGVPAALLSVSLSRTISANVGDLLKRRHRIMPPASVAAELNRRFPVMSESDQFFTFLYGVLDTTTRVFTFVHAGHPGPVILSAEGIRKHEVPPNPPIGILDDVEFVETTVFLAEGDLVFLYTDGLVEAQDVNGEVFGSERMLAVLQGHGQAGVADCIETMYAEVRRFTMGLPQKDDITLLGFEMAPIPVVGSGNTASDLTARFASSTGSGRHRLNRIITQQLSM